jgi:hypothetical protein
LKEKGHCNGDRAAGSWVKNSDKVREIKNWGFCIDRNTEKLQSNYMISCVSNSFPVFYLEIYISMKN